MNLLHDPTIPLQIPLLGQDGANYKTYQKRRHKVEQTIARIHQLRDELNAQLYTHPSERPAIHSPQDAFTLLDCFIGRLDHEEMWVINLDTRNRLMSLVSLYKGSVNSSQVRISEVYRQAILDNAPAILISHNHPSGDVIPSPEDINLTRTVLQVGKLLDIELLDHLIISMGRFCSLKEKGLGFS